MLNLKGEEEMEEQVGKGELCIIKGLIDDKIHLMIKSTAHVLGVYFIFYA